MMQNRSHRRVVSIAVLFAALVPCLGRSQTLDEVPVLQLEDAVLLRNQSSESVRLRKDAFSPGVDGAILHRSGNVPGQFRWTMQDVPEGDYYLELPIAGGDYLGFSETLPGRIRLYLNDTPLAWKGHTFPTQSGQGTIKDYIASLVTRDAVRIESGDLLRIVGGNALVAAPRLHREAPSVDVELPSGFVQMPGKRETPWLELDWQPTERSGNEVTQSCWLFNPGARPRAVRLKVEARDFLMSPLLDSDETIMLQPLERAVRSFTFRTGAGGRTRVSLEASAEDTGPTHFLSKFFVDDIQEGPRPRTSLNGDWEMCYVSGVEPGDAPPTDAVWEPSVVPATHENKRGHCMWFRRDFESPPHLEGERFVIRFGQVMSESWLYVNERLVHHQFDGAEPFEADVSEAWIPGQTNRILVAVRDWLAYSPVNRERVLRGEPPVMKDGMIAPAGYFAMGSWGGSLGMGQPVYLEARPAVSVADVAISTTVHDRRLRLAYRLVNHSATKVEAIVAPVILDAGRERYRLGSRTVEIDADGVAETLFDLPWPQGVTLWQPGAPYLYVLQTALTGGGHEDRHIERFGFRDIRIDGVHFIVNGVPMKMRSSWTSVANGVGTVLRGPPEPAARFERIWNRQMLGMHTLDVQISRTHNNTGIRDALEMADETGLMIKPENGNFCQQKFTFEETFWRNAEASQLRMVEAYRNHASVFMWSAGNENMWAWMYQGQEVRDVGNRWQVKLAQAMRRADPQARPIEWEADGDLLGQWDYHQLHYPRELAGNPAVPVSAWWGPLDGQTIVPYSMGPITLGEKPLTVGEAFWPAMLSLPLGASILQGDKAYQGGAFLRHAWMESSQFFINGFRDVEFGLIDTYSPLRLVKPQALVLKQETAFFHGGRTLTRQVNVHNDVLESARLALQWSLRAEEGERVLDSGGQTFELTPAELRRVEIDVSIPSVAQPLPVLFEVTLLDAEGETLHRVARSWLLTPPPDVQMPRNLTVHLYDPEGETGAMLESLGVPFTLLPELQAPQDPKTALILGKGAVAHGVQDSWRHSLQSFVQEGGRLVVLEQKVTPEFVPFPVTLVPKSDSTLTFVRAAGHPLMQGIDDSQLRWWSDDHFVSRGNYRKPVSGNVLPLVDAGTMDGLLETPLMEQFLGKGSILLCQMLLSEKAAIDPVAGRLLQNLLDYLAAPAPVRTLGKTVLFAGSNENLRLALEQSRLVFETPADETETLSPLRHRLAIVDVETALTPTLASALRAFAAAGGNVLLHRAGPTHADVLESLLGTELIFTEVAREASSDVRYKVLRRGNSELLDGISNHEFFWAPKRVVDRLRRGSMSSLAEELKPEECLAEFFCSPATPDGNVWELTTPSALLAVPIGRGMIVLNQLRIDDPIDDVAHTAARLRSLLLTNLGGTVQGRDASALSREDRIGHYTFFPISLEPYANRGLRDYPDLDIVGWTNQGENDMRDLPVGESLFADVPFVIPEPKSVIVLSSTAGRNADLPFEVNGITVGRKADALFFLHSVAWGGRAIPFMYRVHYADGSRIDVPMRQGRQIFDWWGDPARNAEEMEAGGTVVGFSGNNPFRQGVIVLLHEWINPRPEAVIASVDFTRFDDSQSAVPVMVGLTVAVREVEEGVVTDVIGLHGARILFGARTVDVHYIGVAALDEQHPFHAEALAAHKAMVIGQKVRVQDDVVAKNAQGRRVAYVFFGDGEGDGDLRDLVNARLIGEGFAPLGGFEENNLHRMYLENLAFIASQGKKGVYGVDPSP